MKALAWILAIVLGSEPGREPELERVEVHVSAISGEAVYVDRGRDAHIEVGDVIRILPTGLPALAGRIASVSRTGARAELVVALDGVSVGDLGIVLVPKSRLEPDPAPPAGPTPSAQAPPAQEPVRPVPEHPPWQEPPGEWNQETPLLAPVASRRPEERDRTWRGRVFTQLDATNDERYSATYWSSLSGIDLEMDNPFGHAGRAQLRGSLFARHAELVGDDDSESRARLDRVSYRYGDPWDRPTGWEAGRFLQNEFPELGVLDGFELFRHGGSSHRYGASLGFLPEWTDEFETGDDFQAAAYYRYVSGPAEELSVGAAFQKTWHQGTPDRDLLVSTLAWHPTARSALNATAWTDFYTASDVAKGSGVELTQLRLDGSLSSPAGNGAALYASHLRYPELLREEYAGFTPEQLANDYVQRAGTRGWWKASDHLRVDGRAELWGDQDDSGRGAGLRASLTDWLYERGTVSVELFGDDGKFTDSLGVRLYADRRLDAGFLRLSWDATSFEQHDVLGPRADLLQHLLRAAYDWTVGGWDFSVYAEGRFGDEQDSQTIGFSIQRRF